MNASERLRDLLISHQVGIIRLANAEQRRAVALLERALAEAMRELRSRLRLAALSGFDPGPATTLRQRAMVDMLRRVLFEAYQAIGEDLEARLLELAAYEADYMERVLRSALPDEVFGVGIGIARPSPELLQIIIRREAFRGALLRDYFSKSHKVSLHRLAILEWRRAIQAEIADAVLTGRTVEGIARRLRSSMGRAMANGLKAVVDTAVKFTMQRARQKFMEANSGDDGVVKGYVWISTLDLRTTVEYCIPRDGKTYDLKKRPVGHGYAWGGGPGAIHFRCRSATGAWLKSWRELGLDRDELPKPARASMDGQVPGSVTAEDWLRGRSQSELERVFGVRRAELFRSGELSVDDMVLDRGGLVTLDRLREQGVID